MDGVGKGVGVWTGTLGASGDWIADGKETKMLGSVEDGSGDLLPEVSGGTGVSMG